MLKMCYRAFALRVIWRLTEGHINNLRRFMLQQFSCYKQVQAYLKNDLLNPQER